MSFPKIAVVGAGLAGLACARRLPPTTVVFEKSRVLGGRCATKQWASSRIDHGVQCFTLTSPVVRELLYPLLRDELRTLPDDCIVSTTALPHNHGPQRTSKLYYCSSGNSMIGKALANTVNVIHEAKVTQILPSGEVFYESGSGGGRTVSEQFDLVICTPPLPQVCDLLGTEVDTRSFVPNLTALLHYDGSELAECSMVHKSMMEGSPYAYVFDTEYGPFWSACENAKRGREVVDGGVLIVVQASDEFSKEFVDSPSQEWVEILRKHAEERWKIPRHCLVEWFGKRWKFAKVDRVGEIPQWTMRRDVKAENVVDFSERILVCGDGVCGVSEVESALLQGIGAATRARELLKVDMNE